MREILFRGKRVNNGEWVYGYFCGRVCDTIFSPAKESSQIIDKDLFWHDVLPKTVGQFTGLKDKNSKKIFEGDVVKITDEFVNGTYYAYVEFGNPNGLYTFGWQLVPLCKTAFAVEILHWVDMEASGAFIEVIGNIHDNPELLEEEK